jgi:flagellar basal-body rod protein FlgC
LPNRLDIPLSGLQAARRRQAASAQNTANLQTDGYERQRTVASEAPQGGVRTRVDTVALSDEARTAAAQLEGAQNNVEPVEEAVAQGEARSATAANARVVRTTDRMTGWLLDALA